MPDRDALARVPEDGLRRSTGSPLNRGTARWHRDHLGLIHQAVPLILRFRTEYYVPCQQVSPVQDHRRRQPPGLTGGQDWPWRRASGPWPESRLAQVWAYVGPNSHHGKTGYLAAENVWHPRRPWPLHRPAASEDDGLVAVSDDAVFAVRCMKIPPVCCVMLIQRHDIGARVSQEGADRGRPSSSSRPTSLTGNVARPSGYSPAVAP